MENDSVKNKMNKMMMGVSIGFAVGAFSGTIIGVLTNDYAVWLAVGTGCGIATGAGIGVILENLKKNK